MKKQNLFLLSIFLCFFITSYANINFPDTNFKQALLNHTPVIDGNRDGEISINEAKAVIRLNIDGQNISNLDGIQYFENLEILDCSNNNIRRIDASHTATLTKLRFITARNNQISFIDVRTCALWGLRLDDNLIEYAYLAGPSTFQIEAYYGIDFDITNVKYVCITKAQYNQQDNGVDHLNFWNSIGDNLHFGCSDPEPEPVCEIVNIPDPNFKALLVAVYDLDKDGEICVDEAKRVTSIGDNDNKNIADLTGIEYLVNLEIAFFSFNNITSADFSKNLKLEQLGIDHNPLTSINLKNNQELFLLHIGSTPLTEIDLSHNKNLRGLEISYNKLTTLDLSHNVKLEALLAIVGSLKSLNIRNCSLLRYTQLWDNQLTSLDISTNTSLEDLQISNNQLTSLNIAANNAKLKSLIIDDNLLRKIDIRNCTSIEYFNISNNPNLTEAYLTGNHKFYKSYNSLRSTITSNFGESPKLNFLCVNPVPYINDIRHLVNSEMGYTNCIVSTDCMPPLTSTFDEYFVLSPNPASSFIELTSRNISFGGNAGVTIVNLSGEIVKKELVKFTTNSEDPGEFFRTRIF